MLPSGPPTPIGGTQSGSHALLRSNSAILGSQGGSMPPQGSFSSLVSPRTQYNMNLLGNSPNVSSLLNQTLGNGGSGSSLSGLGHFQRGSVDNMGELNRIPIGGNDVGFTSSLAPSNMVNSGLSGQTQSQQIPIPNPSGSSALSDQQQSQLAQYDPQKFQHGQQSLQQFPVSHSQTQQQQPQFQSIRGGLGAVGPVKLEPQGINDRLGLQQKLQSLQSLGAMKLEPQQNQIARGMGPVKLENQQPDQGVFLQQQRQQQQQQQQQFLSMSRQSSPATIAQMTYLQQQQQRMLQLQQQQQQQLFRTLPQQQPQLLQQLQQQNLPVRSSIRPVYEPGTCARRLTQYIYQQQHRPNDNNIEFWRKFVAEFFAPNARKRWCVSMYGNSRQTSGVFPQDLWHCEICNRKPGRGFETTVEVLPRLFKIKYDSGTLEELLYLDMPHEYQNANGQIILDYAKAIQESVFEHLRVVRDGQLRIVFSPDLKICSWEFCAQNHEELIPRRLIIPQVSQLAAAAQKYQASAQNASASCNSSNPELENNCNMFLASARQLSKALEVPLVNELGYTKRYIRCLQISEVVNSMKDLIDYSKETDKGAMESLAKFPRKTGSFSGGHSVQQPELQEQVTGQTLNNDHLSAQASAMHPAASNGVASGNSSHGTVSTTTANTIVGLIRQSSMNSQIDNQINNPGSPYTGTPAQIPSAGSSSNLPPAQLNPSSPFSSPTPSSSNNLHQSSHNAIKAPPTTNHISSKNSPAQVPVQQSLHSNEMDPNESQMSVEKIIQEIMMASQLSEAGSMDSAGNNMKNMNGLPQASQIVLTNGNSRPAVGLINNNSSTVVGGFNNLGGGNGYFTGNNGVRAGIGSYVGSLTGRAGRSLANQDATLNHQQQELANRLLNGVGATNGFFDHQLDWRSP